MIRFYGKEPYTVAVLHGGPGAPGSVAAIARGLSKKFGVIEPIQSKYTINDLVAELQGQIKKEASLPVTLVGHSWGAWLAVLYAEKYPEAVKQIVLVGCAPFEDKYVPLINERRISRLPAMKADAFRIALSDLEHNRNRQEAFAVLDELCEEADNYDLMEFNPNEKDDMLPINSEMFTSIWPAAAEMRTNGVLSGSLKRIQCPVIVIHGQDDPHPVEGVVNPLTVNKINFKEYILPQCGHSPFKERFAYKEFFKILEEVI